VKASRDYRASDKGRQRRREENRRYRARRRARAATATAAREGKRLPVPSENFTERMCDRPGCYVLFWVKHEHSSQRFCSVLCCMALRRVLDREARYQERRRRWRKQRRARRVRPPDTS
jgi:hypothetical protein